MLTWGQILTCEGYYYNLQTGDVLRNIGTGNASCWTQGTWIPLDASGQTDETPFELITPDVSLSFEKVQQLVTDKFGPLTSFRIINRQTARQADGHVITEEASIMLNASTQVRDPVCGMHIDPTDAAGKSEHNGHTYYFCHAHCQRHFDQNPQRYAGRQ